MTGEATLIALARVESAELLLEHCPDEEPEAPDHPDVAIGEFARRRRSLLSGLPYSLADTIL